ICSVLLGVFLYYENFGVSQQSAFYEEFGHVSVQSINYNFSPPVSMYSALKIALLSGGWNSTSLEKNRTVSVSLNYFEFWSNSSFEILNPVAHSVNNYSPITVNDTTFRYIW